MPPFKAMDNHSGPRPGLYDQDNPPVMQPDVDYGSRQKAPVQAENSNQKFQQGEQIEDFQSVDERDFYRSDNVHYLRNVGTKPLLPAPADKRFGQTRNKNKGNRQPYDHQSAEGAKIKAELLPGRQLEEKRRSLRETISKNRKQIIGGAIAGLLLTLASAHGHDRFEEMSNAEKATALNQSPPLEEEDIMKMQIELNCFTINIDNLVCKRLERQLEEITNDQNQE